MCCFDTLIYYKTGTAMELANTSYHLFCVVRNLKYTILSAFTEKAMATHSSVLAWRIPGTAEPGGLPSNGIVQSWTRLKRLSSNSSSSSSFQVYNTVFYV